MFRMLHLSEMVGIEPSISSGRVPALVSPLLSAKTGGQLASSVSEIIRRIGFETFVYAALIPHQANDADIVVVTTMSPDWIARYGKLQLFERDPRVQHCRRYMAPFLWGSCRSHGPSADAWLQAAGQHGMRSGIALPLRS